MNIYALCSKVLRLCVQVVELILFCIGFPLFAPFWAYESEEKLNKDGKIKTVGRCLAFRGAVEYILWNYDRPPYEVCAEYAQRYSGANFIGKPPLYNTAILHVSDLQLVKQIMGSSIWTNRFPEDHYVHVTTGGKPLGLLTGCGDVWQQSRRIMLKILHNLDFFKTSRLEDLVRFEINEFRADLLTRVKDAPDGSLIFSPHHVFQLPAMNIVFQVVMRRRFDHSDSVISKIMEDVRVANRQVTVGFNPLEFIPGLSYLHFLVPSLHTLRRTSSRICNFFKEVLEERRARGTYKLQPEDFVDYFLQEIDAGKNPHLTDEALLHVLRDLMIGGMETTASALEYGLLHLSMKPEIQRRVQEEIEDVIGSRMPAYEDRLRMPYTQAVIQEILRLESVFPLTARSPIEDTKVEAYPIPKNSLCGINLYYIHRDPKLWDAPEEFRPERFLTPGDNPTLINSEKMIPFGYGKRSCVGETLSRCSIFIFLVTILQSFTFRLSESHSAPSIGHVHGVTRGPPPYFLVVKQRLSRENAEASV